jgi:SAM-dependent methyltransferase
VPEERTSWPGRSQREPRRGQPGWIVRQPLADWLRREGADAAGKRVLDVGCGDKPYYPFFGDASSYIGLDVQENAHADIHGAVEAIPTEDASFDIVLCTQVLEHADDPGQAVREMYRVTAPGGRVLASTHGTMVFHPNPVDHWRWTHTGLERLFGDNGDWARLDVQPGAGTASTLAMLLGGRRDPQFGGARARLARAVAAREAPGGTLRELPCHGGQARRYGTVAAAIFMKAANAGFFAPRAVIKPDCQPLRFGSSLSRNHSIMSMRGFFRAMPNACFR